MASYNTSPGPSPHQTSNSHKAYMAQRPKWDARALLNPKAAATAQNKQATNPSLQHNQPLQSYSARSNGQQASAPNLQFQFESRDGSKQDNDMQMQNTNGEGMNGPGNISSRNNFATPQNGAANGANGMANGMGNACMNSGLQKGVQPNGSRSGTECANTLNRSAQYAHSPTGQTNGYMGQHSNGFTNVSADGVGMAGMVELMHKVVDRSEVVPKRPRAVINLDDDDEPVKKRATFAHMGQSGPLGQYMKDQAKEGHEKAAANGRVDLTEEDDVELLDDPEEVEVCYGRIEGAQVKAHRVPAPKPGTFAIQEGFWPAVKVNLRRREEHRGTATTCIEVVDYTRQAFGCLDANTSMALAPLIDSSHLLLRPVARIMTRPKKHGDKAPGQETSERFDLDVTLYGQKKHAKQVGNFLSQKQLWLRSPFMMDAGKKYVNPHAELQRIAQNQRARYSYTSSYTATVRTAEEVKNEVNSVFDTLQQADSMPETEAVPPITTKLLQHQKQGLSFMIARERKRVYGAKEQQNNSLWRLHIDGTGRKTYTHVITGLVLSDDPPETRGGILADMMGLGKTLSILSLIASSLDEAKEYARTQGPDGTRERLKATLLVSPLSTISNWEEQIATHVCQNGLKYHIYHGPSKCRSLASLADYDIIITTYGTAAAEFRHRENRRAGNYLLDQVEWFRIVLDEAHMIREQNTQQSRAICSLQAQRRWAVTGTPVQNRLDDLGALLKFLRLSPFDEKRAFAQYILLPCKSANADILPKLRLLVDSITLRRLKDRINLPKRTDKTIRLEFSPDEKEIYEIFAKNAADRVKVLTSSTQQKLAGTSYVHILQSILRLRLICAHGKELLSEEDLKLTVGARKSNAIDLEDEDETDKSTLSAKVAYDLYNLMRETNADKCSCCGVQAGRSSPESETEGKEEVVGYLTPCFHIICRDCFPDYKGVAQQKSQDGGAHTICSLCNNYTKMDYFPLKTSEADKYVDDAAERKYSKSGKVFGAYGGPHSKTKYLINDLLNWQVESESLPADRPIKSVVFSGWTSHLNLIQRALDNAGMKYVKLVGSMSRAARGESLEKFRTDPDIRIILVSIGAGGLGLNLTTANKIYVMEPQYNPAAEAQAVDRVHRLGQEREVETIRLIMKDSFEEKMLELQDKKKKLASLSMDREKGGRAYREDQMKKRLEDLRSLFR